MNDGYTYSGSGDSGPIPPAQTDTPKIQNNQPQKSSKGGLAVLLIVASIFVVPFVAIAIVFIAYIPTVNRMIDESSDFSYGSSEGVTLDENQQRVMARLFASYYDDELNAIGIPQRDCHQINAVAQKLNTDNYRVFERDICNDSEIKYAITESSGVAYLEVFDNLDSVELGLVDNFSRIVKLTHKVHVEQDDSVKAIKINDGDSASKI